MSSSSSRPLSASDERFAQSRHDARLAAAQALYQLEFGGRGVDAVVKEFLEHRLSEEHRETPVDTGFFEDVVRGVVANQGPIDEAISSVLAEGWALRRIDSTARAILRAGGYEILYRGDTPTAVIVDSMLTVADAFFSGSEPRFIHGALDALAREKRLPGGSGDAG